MEILPLWKEDEYEFTQNLFRKAVLQKEENDSVLQNYSRIGKRKISHNGFVIDEFSIDGGIRIFFYSYQSNINEYIEISKFYSTPRVIVL